MAYKTSESIEKAHFGGFYFPRATTLLLGILCGLSVLSSVIERLVAIRPSKSLGVKKIRRCDLLHN